MQTLNIQTLKKTAPITSGQRSKQIDAPVFLIQLIIGCLAVLAVSLIAPQHATLSAYYDAHRQPVMSLNWKTHAGYARSLSWVSQFKTSEQFTQNFW